MKKFINILLIKIKLTLKKCYMFFYQKIHGIENNKIVFSSFNGKQYSDNGRYISEELHRRDKNLKIVWLLNEKAMEDKYNIIPSYVIKKKNDKLEMIKQIATSKVFITNSNFSKIYKNKNQMFIDTWHGDRGFKRVLYEAYDGGKRPVPVYDDKVTDYCIAASEYGVRKFRKAFRYNGKIIKEGMPRNDALVNNNRDMTAIKERIGVKDEKLLLYAPTFRDFETNEHTINIDFDKILSELSKDGNEWKLIIRGHVASKGFNVKVENDKVIDLSDYPDMADLLLVSDFLITDYSSSCTDFSLTYKPVILFMYDYDLYKESCRKFCADPKEVGFIYAENEEELLDIIKKTTIDEYKKACEKVNNYYNINETGKSTEIICDYIMDYINNNRKG